MTLGSFNVRRKDLMHTKDKLADALAGLGLMEMADIARTGYYHDFLSPLELPALTLYKHLAAEALKTGDGVKANRIRNLMYHVQQGEFDASPEESEEWAASAEGQAAMKSLTSHG